VAVRSAIVCTLGGSIRRNALVTVNFRFFGKTGNCPETGFETISLRRNLDCALVLFTDLGELREVLAEGAVVEGEVNHAIGLGSAAAQAFQIFKVPSMHLGPGGDQRLSASLATSEAEYLISSVNLVPERWYTR
jgi:hypothetical protein